MYWPNAARSSSSREASALFELKPLGLQVLDLVQDGLDVAVEGRQLQPLGLQAEKLLQLFQGLAHRGIVGPQIQPQLLGLHEDVAPARQVGDRDDPGIAHQGRVDVLIGLGVALHRGGVDARLVGEGALAHIRLIAVGADVGRLHRRTGRLR